MQGTGCGSKQGLQFDYGISNRLNNGLVGYHSVQRLMYVWQSIRDYSGGQDEFNWNYGMALAASGNYEEAEEALLSIKNEEFRSEYHYQAWLSQCYIANGKANLAWELHLSTEASSASFRLQANLSIL